MNANKFNINQEVVHNLLYSTGRVLVWSIKEMNDLASVGHPHSHCRRRRQPRRQLLTARLLCQQNLAFRGTGGVSAGNCSQGFRPAFLDTESGTVHLSCYEDGRPAPLHLLDGLPQEWVIDRAANGKCLSVEHSVVAGFVRAGIFYTREQAACL